MTQTQQGTPSSAGRILIVDDDAALVQALRLSLELEGHRISTVARSADALAAATTLRPDLIILDVMMPGIDGWEILRAIRADSNVSGTPVMMLTAKESEESKYTGFTLGADDYLTKPFSIVELRCRVAALLRRSVAVREPRPEIVKIPVLSGASGQELIEASDIFFVQGIRNYTYVFAYEARHLSKYSLGELDDLLPRNFMRVQRSFIVNLERVKACRWATRSSFRLRLGDLEATELPVSRTMVTEVRARLGLR